MLRGLRGLHPNHIIIGSFLCVIAIGTALFSLPICAVDRPLAPIDALFTCTSAVCVTGLTVVDTGTALSRFGQIMTLILIQIGGLGITTFSTFFVFALGGRVSLRGRAVVESSITQFPFRNMGQLLGRILVVTLIIEGVGALLLFPLLRVPGREAFSVFTSVYHAVSAFCNAGFSLYSTNLEAYVGNVPVSLLICALVILGGLGFVTLVEVGAYLARRSFRRKKAKRRFSLHTRLALSVTAILLVVGTAVFFSLEYDNALAGFSLGKKLLVSFVHSVTPRTCGFNTVRIGMCTNATLFFLILLMFVGASPGSTGGGIKTTSLGVLVGLAVAKFRGREDVNYFARRVPDQTVSRAISVTFFSMFLIVVMLILLCVVEAGTGRTTPGGSFLALAFEVTSAFGTVGLSTGITSSLSVAGKLLITLIMMVGRLGPLTIVVALAARETRPRFRYAQEDVMIG
ncbi:MAG: potassium transporter TrkG [Candidatus Eisenbacteria bacterium]